MINPEILLWKNIVILTVQWKVDLSLHPLTVYEKT